ncbi:MAG TPA: diguanylate cyclase [Verrucomicrobiae bacterium]|nr:diguanylate cyclase [Verrucomicrobiae bacterium]
MALRRTRRPRRPSFAVQFAAILLALGVVMAIGTAAVPLYQSQRDRQVLGLDSAARSATVAGAVVTTQTADAARGVACQVAGLSQTVASFESGSQALRAAASFYAAAAPPGDVVVLVGPTGAPIAVQPPSSALPLGAMVSPGLTHVCGRGAAGYFSSGPAGRLYAVGVAPVLLRGRLLGGVGYLRPLRASLVSSLARILLRGGPGSGVALVVAGRFAAPGPFLGRVARIGEPVPASVQGVLRGGRGPAQATVDGRATALAATGLRGPQGPPAATILVAQPLAPPGTGVSDLVAPVALAAVLVLTLAMVAVYLVVEHYLARPLRQLGAAVARLREGDYTRPVEAAGADEIVRLAANFDLMRERLHAQLVGATGRTQIAAALNSAEPIDTVLHAVLRALADLLHAGLVVLITRPDPEPGGDLRVAVGTRAELPTWSQLTAAPGLLGSLARRPTTVIRGQLTDLDRGPLEHSLDLRDCLVVPLQLGERVRGLLAVGNARRPYSADDRMLCQSVADQILVAIEKSVLLEVSQREANTDAMTGLYNFRFLRGYLDQQLNVADRMGSSLTVLMLDLDHFKALNDAHGHPAGDAALRAFGRKLLDSVRRSDLAARYGGEEFTVVMANTGRTDAEVVADKIRQAVRSMPIPLPDGRVLRCSVSIGGVVFPEGSGGDRNLLALADRALYMAKRNGRDRVEFLDLRTPDPALPTRA